LKKPKNSKSRFHRFSANGANQLQLSSKFSVLEAHTLELGQKTPVPLKHGDGELKSITLKTEK
jgi:hypothetical protein